MSSRHEVRKELDKQLAIPLDPIAAEQYQRDTWGMDESTETNDGWGPTFRDEP